MEFMNSTHNYHKVSVVIPVYKDQAGIDLCLVALADQTYPADHYEVIVVDNASEPPITINAKYGHFARLVVCRTQGSYAARNAGILVSTGDVLAFTDADCIPDRDWISSGVDALFSSDGDVVVGGAVEYEISRAPTAVELYQVAGGFMQQENIKYRGFAATANLFVAKRQLEKIGFYDESLLSAGDLEWCWRARQVGISVIYAHDVKVTTNARRSLAGAIRQARRVAGGRYALRIIHSKHIDASGIKPHREGWAAIKWILNRKHLTVLNRMRVLAVAVIIKVAAMLELVRLRSGQKPERR